MSLQELSISCPNSQSISSFTMVDQSNKSRAVQRVRTILPFLQLPPEIRNMIYSIIFTSTATNHLISPDIIRSRKANNMAQKFGSISQCLPLLRTCRQAHEEATAVLYGNNTFYFNDFRHGAGTYTSRHFRNKPPLPMCDFATMGPFLTRIGSEMRAKIRHVRLGFTSQLVLRYAYALDHNPAMAGEAYIGEAFKLLSAGAPLPILDVQFDFYGGEYCTSQYRRRDDENSMAMRELFSRHMFELFVSGDSLSESVQKFREGEKLRFIDFM